MAILDMDLKDYNNLNKLLDSIPGVGQGMTNESISMSFGTFFLTRILCIPRNTSTSRHFGKISRDLSKLYDDASEIAKHFTCQKNGRIYSHVSLLRAYDKAWMIHHHAARPMDDKYMGFVVIKQLILYLNGAHLLPSAHMEYAFCYIRPKINSTSGFTMVLHKSKTTQKSPLSICSATIPMKLT